MKYKQRIIDSLDEYQRVQKIVMDLTPADTIASLQDVKMLSKQALRSLLRWRETVLSAICERTAVSDIGDVKRFQDIQKEEIDVLAEQEHQISLQKLQRDKSILRKQKKVDRRQSRRLANFDSENVNDNVVRDRDLFNL